MGPPWVMFSQTHCIDPEALSSRSHVALTVPEQFWCAVGFAACLPPEVRLAQNALLSVVFKL